MSAHHVYKVQELRRSVVILLRYLADLFHRVGYVDALVWLEYTQHPVLVATETKSNSIICAGRCKQNNDAKYIIRATNTYDIELLSVVKVKLIPCVGPIEP